MALVVGSLPILTSCVSALDDAAALGVTSAEAAAAKAGEGVGSAASSAPAKIAAATKAEVAAADMRSDPPDGPVAAARDDLSSGRDDDDSGSIASYADRRAVSAQGHSLLNQTAAKPVGGSLYASLFARSEAKTPIKNEDARKASRVVVGREAAPGKNGDLPGVDPSSLFEIGQRVSADEDAIEDSQQSYQVASLTGFARLAPNGLQIQRDDIQTSCFPSRLVQILHEVEQHFGTKVIVTSGYRSPEHNREVNGATRSQHMACKAADILIPNTDRFQVAAYVRSLPERGGVGTYCQNQSIHVDVGPRRDWNWTCHRRD